jgi:hypothetical protein
MKIVPSAPWALLIFSIFSFTPVDSTVSTQDEASTSESFFEFLQTQTSKIFRGLFPTATSAGPSSKPSSVARTRFHSRKTTAAASVTPQVTTFYALADIPYSSKEAAILKTQMQQGVPSDAEFLIHLGDLRRAGANIPCIRSDYTTVADSFKLSRAPVLVILGDNESADCPNQTSAKGLRLWKSQFLGFESKYWKPNFAIQRQPGRRENFSYTNKGTLFIALNIIGGEVKNATEWSTRLTDEVNWTVGLIRTYKSSSADVGRVVIFGHANPNSRHDAFFVPLKAFIKDELQNQIPILYLHGDGHKWAYEPNYLGLPSFLRIMVTAGGVDPLLNVTVIADGKYLDPQKAFAYDRRLSS